MAVYTSNVNRITGLASGIDTDSMIEQLMKAESAKYERLQKQQTKVSWQQEAFRELISSMDEFKNKWFGSSLSSNIGYSSFWNNYKTSVKDSTTGADSNIVTIKSTTNSGSYNINVIQKAETESITGGDISTSISTEKTAEDIKNTIDKYGSISLKVSLDGQSKEINIKKEDLASGQKLDDVFNEKLKEAFGTNNQGEQKVKASIENGKLNIVPTGQGHSVTIADGSERTEGTSYTKEGALATSVKDFELTIDGYTAKVTFTEDDDTAQKRLEKIQNALKEATKSDGTSEEKKDLSSYVTVSSSGDNLVIKNNSKTQETSITVKVDSNSETQTLNPTGSSELIGFKNTSTSVKLSSKLSNVFGESFDSYFKDGNDEITLNFGGKDVIINKDETIQSFINKVNSSEGNMKLSFNEVTNRFTAEASQSGENGNVSISNSSTVDFLKNITKIDVENKESNTKYVQGKDAIFEVDGIQTTRPSNEVSMNGIEFTINGTGSVNLDAKVSTDDTLEKIKSFVEDYNKLVEKFNSSVTENRVKTSTSDYYEPLTDDEKKALSEDEIKKWEEQAKKGLLYRDENLSKFLSSLRSNVYKSVDIGGKSISLYEIGITTSSNYNDGGKLVIDEDKLKKALEERGDEVRQLFTATNGVADSVKASIDSAIGSKGYLRQKAGIKGTTSATNNDLTEQLKDIAERLAAEKERLYNKETRYYSLFAKMESAMTQQNNQLAALLSYSGS